MADEITGGCGCGNVRWRLNAPPTGAAFCHCTRCQRRTGTGGSPSARIAPGSLEFERGEQLLKAWAPDGGWRKFFCSECGSAVMSQDPENEELIGLRLGGFDSDPGVRPKHHQFAAYASPWLPIPDDGLPRYDESAPG
jgi:hypothetical protein